MKCKKKQIEASQVSGEQSQQPRDDDEYVPDELMDPVGSTQQRRSSRRHGTQQEESQQMEIEDQQIQPPMDDDAIPPPVHDPGIRQINDFYFVSYVLSHTHLGQNIIFSLSVFFLQIYASIIYIVCIAKTKTNQNS